MSVAASWVPMEANPEVFTQWMQLMGVDTDCVEFVDIFGLDEELLAMVPQPVHAIILLYPVGKGMDEKRRELFPPNYATGAARTRGVWYLPQTIGNACATVALLHLFANLPLTMQKTLIKQNGVLGKFLTQSAGTTTSAEEERVKLFEANAELAAVHHQCADQGQTTAPEADTDVDLHFVCLIVNGADDDGSGCGRLMELDGRQTGGPIDHGPITTKRSFLFDAANRVIRRLMNLDPSQMQYTMMALVDKSK